VSSVRMDFAPDVIDGVVTGSQANLGWPHAPDQHEANRAMIMGSSLNISTRPIAPQCRSADNRRGYRLPATGYRLPATGYRLPATGYRLTGLAVAALLSGSGLLAMVFAPTANAKPIGTVMAKAQRMSAPNLNSQQDGWYHKGDKLTLKCFKRGQAVKGYFSFNIPNGGWDNLWYKVSDNHFVADVDIETGTLKTVTGECGHHSNHTGGGGSG